jgi:5,10-methenyltetrahydrofolate synthetase
LEDKKTLRNRIQYKRNRLGLSKISKKSKKITSIFLESIEYKKAKNILIYYPFRSEVDTTSIIKEAIEDGKKVILPKVSGKSLRLYKITDPALELEKGAFGIMEPVEALCLPVGPEQIDLAVVPGVCFDKKMNRIGYGGGFYDRLIELIPENTKKIALCFELQILPGLPVSEHDKKVDKIITESATYEDKFLPSNHTQHINRGNIAILIPAYNEAKYIEGVIRQCLKDKIDIIVVDDGSSDGTAEIVSNIKNTPPPDIFLIQHRVNRGKGQALKTGFAYAVDRNYKGVITIDADGQHKTDEIKDFLTAARDHSPDLIIGSRFQNLKAMPFIRLATNVFTSWIISAVAGRKVNDVQSGFRFIGDRVLKNINLETKNFETEPEIILKAGWMKYKIMNIPITTIYHKDFVSHVNPFIDTFKFFRLIFKSIVIKRRFMRSHTML